MIDTTKLEIGQTFKDYTELCAFLGEPVKGGESKNAQLKEWSRYFKYERPKWKRAYIITEIYAEPLPKEDLRHLGNRRGKTNIKEKSFKVSNEEALRPGVYKIENNDYVYIGSTTRRLSTRFSEHYHNNDGNHNKTQKILKHRGTFKCLESFEEDTEEHIIRECEAKYIQIYKQTLPEDKVLLNEYLPESRNKSEEEKIKYKHLRVPEQLFDQVISALGKEGFLIMDKTVYHKQFRK